MHIILLLYMYMYVYKHTILSLTFITKRSFSCPPLEALDNGVLHRTKETFIHLKAKRKTSCLLSIRVKSRLLMQLNIFIFSGVVLSGEINLHDYCDVWQQYNMYYTCKCFLIFSSNLHILVVHTVITTNANQDSIMHCNLLWKGWLNTCTCMCWT